MTGVRIRRRYSVFWYRRSTIIRRKTLMNRCTVFLRNSGGRCTVFETRMSAFWLRTVVPTDLNHALEVDIHAIREFERLEVCETDHRCAWSKVLDLLESEITRITVKDKGSLKENKYKNEIENQTFVISLLNETLIKIERFLPRHNLWPDDTSILINKLNRSTLSIMRHAISHQHIELVLVILDREYHRHCLSDLNNSRHFGSPRSLTNLNLHPTLQIVAKEIGGNCVEHVNLEGTECHGFFVKVVPRATQFSRLIPNFLNVRVVLNDYRVLDVTSGWCRRTVSGDIVISRTAHAARIQKYLEGRTEMTSAGF